MELNTSLFALDVVGELLVSSREIASNFEKEHRGVLRDIKNLIVQNCATKYKGWRS